MKLYGPSTGPLAGFRATAEEEALFPIPDGMTVVEADNDSNTALLTDLRRSTDAYALAAGVLTKNGVPVTINPPTQGTLDRNDLPALLTKLEADTSLSAAELRKALRIVLRHARNAQVSG